MQLYSITDEQFDSWIESQPTERELREAIGVLEAKRHALWDPTNDHDRFYRDRYERNDRYTARIQRATDKLVNLTEEAIML